MCVHQLILNLTQTRLLLVIFDKKHFLKSIYVDL